MNCNKLLLCLFGIAAYYVAVTVARETIINGQVSNPGQFAYQVSLQHEDVHFCAGGIIDKEAILTAAHCVININNQFDRLKISVVAGTNDLKKTRTPAVRLQVTKIFALKEYNPLHRFSDIAVLKLNGAFRFRGSLYVVPLTLPRKDKQIIVDTARIAGWGWDWIIQKDESKDIGGHNSTQIQHMNVKVLNDEECLRVSPRNTDLKKQFCARAEQHHNRHSVCLFDNGGPLVFNRTVIGILSRIPPGCNEIFRPAIYTRVTQYLTFMDNAINNRKTIFMRHYDLLHY